MQLGKTNNKINNKTWCQKLSLVMYMEISITLTVGEAVVIAYKERHNLLTI